MMLCNTAQAGCWVVSPVFHQSSSLLSKMMKSRRRRRRLAYKPLFATSWTGYKLFHSQSVISSLQAYPTPSQTHLCILSPVVPDSALSILDDLGFHSSLSLRRCTDPRVEAAFRFWFKPPMLPFMPLPLPPSHPATKACSADLTPFKRQGWMGGGGGANESLTQLALN